MLKFNDIDIDIVNFNDIDIDTVYMNGTEVWSGDRYRYWGFEFIVQPRGALNEIELLLVNGGKNTSTVDPENILLNISPTGPSASDYWTNGNLSSGSNTAGEENGIYVFELPESKEAAYVRFSSTLETIVPANYGQYKIRRSKDNITWETTETINAEAQSVDNRFTDDNYIALPNFT